MLHIGMIGLGVISRYYTAALDRAGRARLAAVCDLNPERLAQYRGRGVREFIHYGRLLESAEVDAVLINAPNDLHFAIARAALEAGRHVCCEKPLTTRTADALELLEIAARMGRTLFTAFHRRYNVNLRRRLPELLNRSTIASVTADYLELIQEHAGADSWYLDPKRCGGGCIADNGPNVFDSLRSFLGPLSVVSSRIARQNGVDVKASLRLVGEGGIPVEVNLNWQYDRGEKKQITIRLRNGRTISVDFLAGFHEFKGSLWHEYEGVLEEFVGMVERGESDGRVGYDTIRLVEEAYAKEVKA
jgi:L-arabinose 1-dehydrogenase